ncbi:MAG: MFS transporter [Hyphomonadaceae bacterium]|nr:MFS transporter [Hyphomonadaceae bacterium]
MSELPDQSLWRGRAARVTLAMSCLFGATGMIMVFLPRWLEVERGLTGAQIGAVIALAQLGRVGTGPAVAFWADSAADRRTPLRVLSLCALGAYAAFFAVESYAALLVLGFIALSLTSSTTPFIEGAALRATASGKVSYGVVRGIGSVAFIVANVAGGYLIAQFGLNVVVIWALTVLTCFALTNWLVLPPDPAPHVGQHGGGERRAGLRDLLSNRRFVILILACGLIQSSHAFYYSFSTLTWRAQGVTPDQVGLLWSVGVAVEVAFLWTLPFFERRVSPEQMILVGAAGGFVRWVLLGFAPTGAALIPLQMLHALSFAAAHVGAMRLLYREAPEAAAGMAQTLYAVLSAGIFMGLATLGSGVLYDAIGARGYWVMAAMAIAGGALSLLLLPRGTRSQT